MHQYTIWGKDKGYNETVTAGHFTVTANGDVVFENADGRAICAYAAGQWIRVDCIG